MSTVRVWMCPNPAHRHGRMPLGAWNVPGQCMQCLTDRIPMLLLPESEARDWVPSEKGRVLMIDAPAAPEINNEERLLKGGWWKAVDSKGDVRWIDPSNRGWSTSTDIAIQILDGDERNEM